MIQGAAFIAGEEKDVDLTAALRWLNSAVVSSTGNKLREPELVILKGTWRGLTYEQMADGSEYSTNYLMRDVAPKLWKQLSNVFGRSVGKTNFRVALEAYAAANTAVGSELSGSDEGAYGALGGFSSRTGFSESGRASYDFAAALRGRSGTPMVGYADELSLAQGWLAQAVETRNSVRVVGLWGLRGVGKTLLAERLLVAAGPAFDAVVWRSLQDRPTLSDLCLSILAELGMASQSTQAIAQLLSVMSRKSILLLIEDIEAILQPGQLAGDYIAGYEGYEDFFLSVARGCVVVTGIEGPAGLVRQGGYGESNPGRRVRSLTLNGLTSAAANELLRGESLSNRAASMAAWPELIRRYQGHPLALKSAARVIREIFNGSVDEFLAQMSVLFTDISRLLLPSFERLCETELSILYWLASQERSLSLAQLKETLPISLSPSELISALDSLKQRSLLAVQLSTHTAQQSDSSSLAYTASDQYSDQYIEDGDPVDPPTFYLPSLVKAYAIHQFVTQLSAQTYARSAEASRDRALITSSSTGYQRSEPVISLGAQKQHPVQLSQWFEGQTDAGWQPLEKLLSTVARPAVRLRSTYQFRAETFVKRCKSVVLSASAESSKAISQQMSSQGAVLLVAIHQDGERDGQTRYKICVQAQPAMEETVLPQNLTLKLLDAEATVLATVAAEQSDSFIQLPYFQGATNEPFEIELALNQASYREKFVI